jgi:hypothetical protein
MMKVYDPLYEEGYEFCHPVDRNEYLRIADLCNGIRRAETWKPLNMKLVRVDEGKRLVESDTPWLHSHILIVRPRVITALGPLLLEYGELLPLRCPGAELWLYNVTCVIDALNEAASAIDRFRDGRIMLVARPAFRKEVIGKTDIFKISHRRGDSIYFSQRFVDLWHAAKLTGVEFTLAWSG